MTKTADPQRVQRRMEILQAEMARRLRSAAGAAIRICELVEKLPPETCLRMKPEFRDAVEALARFVKAADSAIGTPDYTPRPPSPDVAWMRSVRAAFGHEIRDELLGRRARKERQQ